ncbi:hypothetical protein NUACC21_65060 [Scytonema sp. NUACC21]
MVCRRFVKDYELLQFKYKENHKKTKMIKNWALVIGINQYDFLQPLKYAERDAQLMRDFLLYEADFEQVFLFSNNSFTHDRTVNHPSRANLLKFLQQLSEAPFLEIGDNFWFFFSGHGILHGNLDYLMPSDGNPEDIENTAISINYIIECLCRSGTNNIVLILDACHQQNKHNQEKFGQQTQKIANQTGIVSIFSCSPDEYSYEIEKLQTGAFTYALLEGLGTQGQCATVGRLNQYLSFRVPQLVSQYHNSKQTPYTNAESINKSSLIIRSKYANLNEINTLKINAFQAEVSGNLELAEQLWMQMNAAASAPNTDKIQAIQRIAHLKAANLDSKSNLTPQFVYLQKNGEVNSPYLIQQGLSKKDLLGKGLCSQSEIQRTSSIPIFNKNLENFKNQLIQSDYIDRSTRFYSAEGISYKRLRDFLVAGNWKEADRETLAIMLKVARRDKEGWLNIESINKFPCIELCTIDLLWLKYSNGRFGFSVQQHIWESVADQPDGDYETWCKFCDRISWRVNDDWLFYSDLNFNTNAPEGHLPAASIVYTLTSRRGWVVGLFSCVVGFSALVSKLVKCSL